MKKSFVAHGPVRGRVCRPLACWLALLVFGLAAAPALAADPARAAVPPPGPAALEPVPPPTREAASGKTGRVELRKSAPEEGTLRVGGAASFEARLLVGNRAAPADDFIFRWRSDAGAKFLEAEGPSRNTAVFLRPGRQRVWVEVVPKSGPAWGLAAVSDPVELLVANPSFTLTVTPPAPLVGEEVTVAIRDFPLHDGVEFRWDPLPERARLVTVSERGLTFVPTVAGPVPVKVTASLGGAGPVLGAAKADVVAKSYVVTVENKGLAAPSATIWQDGVGPVAAQGVAVGQPVTLRATVNPPPRHPPLTVAWELCPGAASRDGASPREVLASRSEVGPCPVTATVRDARGLVLGQGTGSFSVAVSQAQLDAAADNVRETRRLVERSGEAWRDGQVDRAWELAAKAARLNPADGTAGAALERVVREKKRLDDLLGRARQALEVDDFDEVAAMLDEAAKVNAKVEARGAIARAAAARREVLARVATLVTKARAKWDAGEVEAALALTGRALALDPAHAGAKAERERLVAGRDKLIAALKQAAQWLAAKRFESAADALSEAKAVNPRFPAIAEMRQAIADRRERAWRVDERLARARDQWNAGDADGALGTLTEAVALAPEQAGAQNAHRALAEARERLLRAEEQAETALARGRLEEAGAALAEARRTCPRHGRLAELTAAVAQRAGRDKRLAELRAEAARRNAAGDLDGAVRAVDEMLVLAPGEAAVLARRDELVRARDSAVEASRRSREYLAARRYDLALAALAEADGSRAGLPALAGLRERIVSEKTKAEGEAAGLLTEARARLDRKDFQGAGAALAAAKKTGLPSSALEKQARALGRRLEAAVGQEAARRASTADRDRRAAQAAAADHRARCLVLGREAAAQRTAGDHAGAIRRYQTLLTLCPDMCPAYNNVGASLYSLGYVAEAVPWFDEAVKCAPSDRLFRDNAAMTRAKLAESARPAAEAAKRCAAEFAAAETRRTAGDLAGAVAGYGRVVARCPDFCAAYNNMGLSLHKLGRTGDALPLFEQALRCNPKDNLFRENYDLTAKRLRAAANRP